MTAGAGRSLVSDLDTSVPAVRGTPRHQRSSHVRRPVRGRESLLRKRYDLAREDSAALREEARQTVLHLLPVAQRLLYTATYYGLFQAQRDASALIGRLESLARRHEVEP